MQTEAQVHFGAEGVKNANKIHLNEFHHLKFRKCMKIHRFRKIMLHESQVTRNVSQSGGYKGAHERHLDEFPSL